jgi:hypothetical protein
MIEYSEYIEHINITSHSKKPVYIKEFIKSNDLNMLTILNPWYA